MRGNSLIRSRSAHRPRGSRPWRRRARRTPLPGGELFLGGALIGLIAATSSAPVHALPFNWSVVPSPNIGRAVDNNELSAVSCFSTDGCVAVGDDAGHNPETALVESWNGMNWSVVPSPKPVHRALYGVSCTSAAACVAVGADFTGAAGAWPSREAPAQPRHAEHASRASGPPIHPGVQRRFRR
jgi:hypothetical protein